MSQEPVISVGAKWLTHVDEQIVCIALVDAVEGPVVGVVCRPSTNEMLSASMDGGAFGQLGEQPRTAQTCGFASTSANVIHVPHAKCPELELAIENLEEKMPLEITREPSCCCCEGLFELVSGRADIHISPPRRCLVAQTTPVPVLCAFEVLLMESGGYMSDVNGEALDFDRLVRTGEHSCGVVATEDVCHNYVMSAVKKPFLAQRLVLPRLRDSLGSLASSFKIEFAGDEQNAILKGIPGALAQPSLDQWDWSKWERGELDVDA